MELYEFLTAVAIVFIFVRIYYYLKSIRTEMLIEINNISFHINKLMIQNEEMNKYINEHLCKTKKEHE